MGWIKNLFGGGLSEVGSLATDIREAIKGKEIDPNKALELIEVQAELTKLEAQHRTVFVAGWRPFIGWICGVALLYNFVLRDMITYIMTLYFPETPIPPALQMEQIITILLGMLGLGGLRSYEKVKGISK